MTDSERKELILDAQMILARGDARSILYRLMREITKTGGERQRSEGLKLLHRIFKRLVP